MAFNILDTSYSGTYSKYFIMKATYNMDTVQKGVVNIIGNIKKKHTIGRIDITNPLKVREATPAGDNSEGWTIDGRLLIPKDAEIYKEFNPRDLETNQVAEQLQTTILDRRVPEGLQSQMMQLLLDRAAEQYETGIWMGALAYAGVPDTDSRYQIQFFDGFIVRMVNDGLINLSTISAVTITITNVLLIMNDLLSQCSIKKKALTTDKDTFTRMKYLMSPNTTTIYQIAIGFGTDFKGQELSSGAVPNWMGYKVVRLAGFPDNTILFCQATSDANGNLKVGMNSMKDWDLKCMPVANNSELWFMQAKFKWDVQYGWPDEIFMYTTYTAASFVV